ATGIVTGSSVVASPGHLLLPACLLRAEG
ncbi:Zinc finger protein 777, partial [Anas platyrhynchos]